MKSQIVQINLARLSNEVFVEFFADIIACMDKFGAGAIGIKQTSDDLKASFQKVPTVLDAVRKSEYTIALKTQDKFRDEVARGLTAFVRYLINSPDEPEQVAARGILLLLDHYWSIPKRSYQKESAAVNDLLKELSTTLSVERLTLLGCTAAVERLRRVNAKFEELVRDRYAEVSGRPKVSMRELRAEIAEKFGLMLYRLEGVIALNGIDFTPELAGFVNEYNVIVNSYKIVLAQEQGRRRAAKANNDKDDADDESNGNDTPETPEEQ
ncbi:MAG: DUF6261 family protein [Odoribacteraceae bacterium]|jgi:hypothetical protein|nr:DUF6261 family protein [Odoribacteraceae bacterium]